MSARDRRGPGGAARGRGRRPLSLRIVLRPRGPYRLAESARFLADWGAARDPGVRVDAPRLVAVRDDLGGGLAALLAEETDGVVATVVGSDDEAAASRQLARVLSLDGDASDFAAVGKRDPLVGELMARVPGFRPVLFGTPYEAAAWALLSQRTAMAQAAAAWRRLAEALGTPLELGGATVHAFPAPAALRDAPGLPPLRRVVAERLRALADAALEGRLDPDRLRALPGDQALAELERLPGIGPFSSGLILVRGCGAPDVLPGDEPRFRAIVSERYGVAPDDDEALQRIADAWRPYRTWVAVLLRSVA